nr:MAG TPA: hypothetical protein [Caudoviricetes sp.]
MLLSWPVSRSSPPPPRRYSPRLRPLPPHTSRRASCPRR